MSIYMEAIKESWPKRNDNVYIRTMLWNVIGYERKFRARQAKRYPLAERFI